MIDEVRQRLAHKFAHLEAVQVSAVVDQALARFEESSVRDFVPLLVERRASDELSRHSAVVAG